MATSNSAQYDSLQHHITFVSGKREAISTNTRDYVAMRGSVIADIPTITNGMPSTSFYQYRR